MNWASLSQNEKLAVYGSIAAIIGGLLGGVSPLIWLSVLAAIGMLVIVFLPMMSPGTTLPGGRGTLMLIAGGVAAVFAVLALLMVLPSLGILLGGVEFFGTRVGGQPIAVLFFFIAVVGSLLMGWAGWQAFQREGGRFNLGAGTGGTGTSGSATSGTTETGTTTGTVRTTSTTTTTDRTDVDDRLP